jgi:hypothetical protein
VRRFASWEETASQSVVFFSVVAVFANESMLMPYQVIGSVVGKGRIGKAERENVTGDSNEKSIRTRGYRDLLGEGGMRDRMRGGEEGRKGGRRDFLRDGTCGRGARASCDTSVRRCIIWHMDKVVAIRSSVGTDGSGDFAMRIDRSPRLKHMPMHFGESGLEQKSSMGHPGALSCETPISEWGYNTSGGIVPPGGVRQNH